MASMLLHVGAFFYSLSHACHDQAERKGRMTDMKNLMNERILSAMRRAGDEAVRAQMVSGSFMTNLNNLVESRDCKKGKLASAANISERTLWKLRNDESYTPTIQTLIAVCIGMNLSFSESMVLLDMSPYRLRHTIFQDGVYTYVLRHATAMGVEEINIYLKELGCEKLGNSM